MLLPGLNRVFNHQSFGLWPFKMLDCIHLGVMAPRVLHRSLERLRFDNRTLLLFISSSIH